MAASHAVGGTEHVLFTWAIAMTAVLLLGLLRRERRGVESIGVERTTVVGINRTRFTGQVSQPDRVLPYALGVAIHASAF